MKKTLLLLLSLALAASARGQVIITEPLDSIPAGYEVVDSVIYTAVARVNEGLNGKTIFSAMPQNVSISHSDAIRSAFSGQVNSAATKKVDGYRIRIFLENKKNSREMSEKAVEDFKKAFPGYNTYRSFDNPFFKVTVGDFRTKADAQIELKRISRVFPAAFIVKEKIRFPIIDLDQAVKADTVKVLRALPVPVTPETK